MKKIILAVLEKLRHEEGRRQLFVILLIPLCVTILFVGTVAYIISSPWSLLSSIFSGEELTAAQSIFQMFNKNGTDPNFIFYSQYDEKWANDVYNGKKMKEDGDGFCSLAMITATYTAEKATPPTIADWLEKNQSETLSSKVNDASIPEFFKTYPAAVDAQLSCTDEYSAARWDAVKLNLTLGNTVAIVKVKGGIFDTSGGKTYPAEYTAYYPANNAMEGGFYDALGNLLDPSKRTCAAPKNVPFGSKILISGTGTEMDGKIFTVNDRGGAIKVKNGTYRFDLLMSTKSECNAWGRRKGQVTIISGNALSSESGNKRYIIVTGQNLDGSYNVADPAQKSVITLNADELENAVDKAWLVTAPHYTFGGDGYGNYGGISAYGWVCPLEAGSYRITSKYGYRIHPISGKRKKHTGLDMAAPHGTPVMAAADGTVSRVQSIASGYGNNVIIDHGGGISSLYGHMSSFARGLQKGQTVKQGQIIGYVGTTGASTGNHLHFEVRKNGTAVDPAGYINY